MINQNCELSTLPIQKYGTTEGSKLGGKIGGSVAHQKAIEARNIYNANPNCCLTCNSPITAPENRKLYETTSKKYCSHSCATKTTNRGRPSHNKPKPRVCAQCHSTYTNTKTHRSLSSCPDCFCKLEVKDMPLSEAIYHTHHKSSAFALVRTRARGVIKKLGWNYCWVCGYSKHVEAAHIEPIASFPLDTLISEINRPDNLTPLCRNHHWEFDHNLLEEEIIRPKLVGVVGVGPTFSSSYVTPA